MLPWCLPNVIFIGGFQQGLTVRERKPFVFIILLPLPQSCMYPILGMSKEETQ